MVESQAFMEDFGDALNDEADPYQGKNGRNAAETLDTSLQAPNANDFSNARLIEEVTRVQKRKGNLESLVLELPYLLSYQKEKGTMRRTEMKSVFATRCWSDN